MELETQYQKHAKDVLRQLLMKRMKIAALIASKLRDFGAIRFGCNCARIALNHTENARDVIGTKEPSIHKSSNKRRGREAPPSFLCKIATR